MENSQIRMKCYNCGNKFTTDQMRMDPQKPGKLICKECLGKADKRESALDEKPAKGQVKAGAVRYTCLRCKYKFTRKDTIPITSCPYCGGEDTLTTKTDINTMLKNAESEEFER